MTHAAVELIEQVCRRVAPDGELLHRFATANDADAFRALVERHGPLVLNTARRVAGEIHADDVFQAAFLALARRAGSLRLQKSLPAWLHRVAFRLALDARRAARRRRSAEAHFPVRTGSDPLDDLTGRELVAALDEELQRLPERYRLPLLLCCLEGCSQDEAARRLGWSAGSVKGRLERGRERLRRRLTRRGLTFAATAGTAALLDAPRTAVAGLIPSTLSLIIGETKPTVAVAALAANAVRPVVGAQVKAAAVLLVALTGLGAGLLLRADQPRPAPAEPPKPAAAKTDVHGDPLPEGATARLGTIQLRAVQSRFAVTPDGKTLVTASHEALVRRWNVADGKRIETIDLFPAGAGPKWVYAVGLSSDGTRLAVTYRDKGTHLEVWDIPARKRLHRFNAEANDVAFSPDGTHLAFVSGYSKVSLSVIELTSGRVSLVAGDVQQEIHFAFSPDGARLAATCFNDGNLAWDVREKKHVWKTKGYAGHIWTFTPDGTRLLIADSREAAGWRVMDAATGRAAPTDLKLPRLEVDDRPVFAPDGRTLLVPVTRDKFEHDAIVWDCREGRELRRMTGTTHKASGANRIGPLTPDGKSVFVGDGVFQRFDLTTGKPCYPDGSPLGHYSEVNQLIFSADGKRLASRAWGWDIRLWDVSSQKILHNLPIDDLPRKMALTPDGRKLVSAAGEKLTVWDTATGVKERKIDLNLRAQTGKWFDLYDVRATADGRNVVASSCDMSGVRDGGETTVIQTVVDLQTGAVLRAAPVTSGGRAGLSDGGRWRAGPASIVDVETGKSRPLALGGAEKNLIYASAFSADERLVAGWIETPLPTDLSKRSFAVWEVATGGLATRISGIDGVYFALSPDGRTAALIDFEGLHFHEIPSGKKIKSYPSYDRLRGRGFGFASAITFSPDGRTVATGQPDGTILLWDAPTPERETTPPTAADWAALADADPAKAFAAGRRLIDAPQQSLPLLTEKIKPVFEIPADHAALTRQLDSADFKTRDDATRRLTALGSTAEPALRAALKDNPGAEKKRRLDGLLSGLDVGRPLEGEGLREVRAVWVLERIGTAEARALLGRWAAGVEFAPLTREAQAALRRLGK